MDTEIDEVIAPDVVSAHIVIECKGNVRDRPPPRGTLSRHVHKLLPIELRHSNVRVIPNVREIIEYKGNVETIAVGNDTHCNQ